jgi:hypothetical protein
MKKDGQSVWAIAPDKMASVSFVLKSLPDSEYRSAPANMGYSPL